MQATDWSFIAIELALVFGGALAFGWWQLRDVEREQRAAAQRRQQQEQEQQKQQLQQQQQQPAAPPAAAQSLDQPERTDGEPGR